MAKLVECIHSMGELIVECIHSTVGAIECIHSMACDHGMYTFYTLFYGMCTFYISICGMCTFYDIFNNYTQFFCTKHCNMWIEMLRLGEVVMVVQKPYIKLSSG